MIMFARALALVLIFGNAASAATLYVSASTGSDANSCTSTAAPCSTLTRALGAVVSGDTVLIASGTYTGGVSLMNAVDIDISGGWDDGVSDPNAATVIEARHDRGLAFLYDGASSGAVAVRNLTIQKIRYGHRSDAFKFYDDDTYSAYGGGLLVLASGNSSLDVVIDHVVFQRNKAPAGGGAALISSGDASMTVTVTDSVFSKNRALAAGGLIILADNASMPTIDLERTTFERNSSQSSIGGLLLAVRHNSADAISTALLSGLTFRDNRGGAADTDVRGGELDLRLENSVFANNASDNWAAALFAIAGPNSIPDGAGGFVTHAGHLSTTSVNNTVGNNYGKAPAVIVEAGNFGYFPAQIEFESTNDIIYGNAGGDLLAVSYFGAPVSLTRHDGIQGPASGASPDVTIVNDNITNVDPRFQGASDLHLRSDSPAIDAVSCSSSPISDIDGDARPQGSQCDIGADEYVP